MNAIIESSAQDYKVVIINIEKPLRHSDISIIKNIFDQFSPNDIAYDISLNDFTLYLNCIDFEYLKDIVSQFKNKENGKELNPIFDEIIYEIESIKSYGLKDKKRLYVNYDQERKVKGRKEKVTGRNQYYYAKDHSFIEQNSQFPEQYKNKIITSDSHFILKQLPDNCVDLIFTSPPYNFGLEYESNGDAHQWEKYFDQLFLIFEECVRILKFGGRIVVNIQPLFSDYIPSHHIISRFFMDKKMLWKGEILWEKNNYNCKYTAWGSWKSPSNPYLKYTWEFLEIFSKGSLKKEGHRDQIDITADEFKKWVVAKWSIAPERNMKNYDHPAMFPEELARRVIKLFSYKNDVVLDPFNGVGTTTYIAKITNRRFCGIDISQEYCEKAQQRINEILL